MTVRDILIIPDKRLRQVSKPVAKVDASIKKLVEDMFDTMYDAPGIGLAAIQIGEPKRVVTMDLAKKEGEKKPQVFINPEIVAESDEKSVHEEGCLSIPEYYEEVERRRSPSVPRLDGKQHQVKARLVRHLHQLRSTISTACCSSIISSSARSRGEVLGGDRRPRTAKDGQA